MDPVNLDDVQAVIDSAVARDEGRIEAFIRSAAPEASPDEVVEAGEVALEVIQSVPILLARAAQAAEEQNIPVVVMPLLERVANYFIEPVDLIPEMTQGLAGLLDDTYLALRMLDRLNRGPIPLMEANFDEPLRFLRRLVGSEIGVRLDAASAAAMNEVAEGVGKVWGEIMHHA